MDVEIVEDYDAMSARAAEIVVHQVRRKVDSVIGFATGSTPVGLYKELIAYCVRGALDVTRLTTFNLDEYLGLAAGHAQSYHRFMFEELFSHIDIDEAKVHIPDGTHERPEEHCSAYEAAIANSGGIDLQILGIGSNGHLGFNEPGSSLGSRTRVVALTTATLNANARFFQSRGDVPTHAITMGIGTILESRTLLLLASGESKAEAIKATLEGPLTAMMPASAIQLHPHTHVIIDQAAASLLTYSHHNGIAEPRK